MSQPCLKLASPRAAAKSSLTGTSAECIMPLLLADTNPTPAPPSPPAPSVSREASVSVPRADASSASAPEPRVVRVRSLEALLTPERTLALPGEAILSPLPGSRHAARSLVGGFGEEAGDLGMLSGPATRESIDRTALSA